MTLNRVTMERLGQLPKRISVLEEDFDEDQLEAEAGNAAAAAVRALRLHLMFALRSLHFKCMVQTFP